MSQTCNKMSQNFTNLSHLKHIWNINVTKILQKVSKMSHNCYKTMVVLYFNRGSSINLFNI